MARNSLTHTIVSECSHSMARASKLELPHYTVDLPMFMPVGTQGTVKGLLPIQVKEACAQIILGNTYHLGNRPGREVLHEIGGLHKFMNWDRGLLTDSGGFQMVSLLQLAKITEEGVCFQSPYDGSECMLTPEESIHIQNTIGADIIMQLDDVVDVKEQNYERFKEAVYRTTRWVDRCIKANKNPNTQSLFPIIQGGTYADLRKISLDELIERDAPGYAIGGLSGGEEKSLFWPVVHQCTQALPKAKPRYCMGVGFPLDIVVCVALGIDMFDCVHPTRTARFGTALTKDGRISLKHAKNRMDFTPIDSDCECLTCTNYTRSYLYSIVTKETVSCHLLSIHNIAYLMKLMKDIRENIRSDTYPQFVSDFMKSYYPQGDYPQWAVDALAAVNIHLVKKGLSSEMNEVKTNMNLSTSKNETSKVSGIFSDVWDENEEDDSATISTDFQNSCFDRGYRDALLLNEFEEELEKGRCAGFRYCVEASGINIQGNTSQPALKTQGIRSNDDSLNLSNFDENKLRMDDSVPNLSNIEENKFQMDDSVPNLSTIEENKFQKNDLCSKANELSVGLSKNRITSSESLNRDQNSPELTPDLGEERYQQNTNINDTKIPIKLFNPMYKLSKWLGIITACLIECQNSVNKLPSDGGKPIDTTTSKEHSVSISIGKNSVAIGISGEDSVAISTADQNLVAMSTSHQNSVATSASDQIAVAMSISDQNSVAMCTSDQDSAVISRPTPDQDTQDSVSTPNTFVQSIVMDSISPEHIPELELLKVKLDHLRVKCLDDILYLTGHFEEKEFDSDAFTEECECCIERCRKVCLKLNWKFTDE